MKLLITLQNNPETNSKTLIYQQTLSPETENIKHSIVEVEDLPEKQSFTIVREWDNEKQTITQKYTEIPKTKEQELEDKIIRLERVLAGGISKDDLTNLPEDKMLNTSGTRNNIKNNKKIVEPTTEDLAELDNLI